MTRKAPSSESVDSTLPLILLACLLSAYVSLRAYIIPITFDEAANYLEFTRRGLLSPFHLPFPHFAANNHLLNSWLTWLTTNLLGVSELTLRLPVLTAHILFLYYTARLSSEFSSSLLRLSSFVVLNVNPYVLDFFSVARGYGLAFGLLAGSLWYLYRFFQTHFEPRYSVASTVFAILAVTAHLTLVHFLIALCAVIVLAGTFSAPTGDPFLQKLFHAIRANAMALTLVSVFLLPTLVVIREFRRAGTFFYGGTTSFWQDTVLSLFDRSLYDTHYPGSTRAAITTSSELSQLLGIIAILIVTIALVVSIKRLAKPVQPGQLYLPALVFLLLSSSVASIAQHHLLNVLYLTGRTGLYLLLLFAFVLVVLANEMAAASKLWQYGLGVVALLLTIHFANCFNLRYVLEWKLAADMKEMLQDIEELKSDAPVGRGNTAVGVNLEFEAPLNYYRAVDHLTWLNEPDRKAKFHPLNDFYLYSDEDFQAIDPDSFVVIRTYPLNRSRLLRRNVRPSRYEITASKTLAFEGPFDSTWSRKTASQPPVQRGTAGGMTDEDHQYSRSIDYQIDFTTVAASRSVIGVKAMIWMESLSNTDARLEIVFRNRARTYAWRNVTVRDFGTQPRAWFPVFFSCFIPPKAQQGDSISVYLRNGKSPVYVDNMEMRWLAAVY
jgi:uncharacterized membrane protein